MTTVRAVRLTAEARRRLRRTRGKGRVHSAFARTINIELDGLGEAGWLSLHGPGPIPSPFGIACEAPPALAGQAGVPVRFQPGQLVVDGLLDVRLDDAVAEDTSVPTAALPPSIAPCLAAAAPTVTDGLLPVAAALLTGAVAPSTPLASLAAPALARLHDTTAVGDAAGCLAAALPLLGLGPGLTPSGDDCVLGWLVGARVGPPMGRGLAERAGPMLLAAAAERTGALSRAFLAAAVEGHVAELLHRFVTAPDDARLAGLLALGETSGADLLAGYLVAWHALAGSG